MSGPFYIIRNYRPDDYDTLIQFCAEIGELEQQYWSDSVQGLIENLGLPSHFPENNLFVAEEAGTIIGYGDVMPEVNIGRAVLSFLVYPKHPVMGLARRFVERAVHRARELGLKRVHVNIPQNNLMAERLFSKMGFTFVRRFFELRLDLSEPYLPNVGRIASKCRHLRRGEEEKLMQIQNRSFANTWGYNPNALEEITYRINVPGSSPEDIIIAYGEDMVIGYCWTKQKFRGRNAKSGEKGRIYMLGVDPDHRGKGVGKKVLLAGLRHLRNKGIKIVEITVDSENEAALALYRSVGFEVWSASLWYEKELD